MSKYFIYIKYLFRLGIKPEALRGRLDATDHCATEADNITRYYVKETCYLLLKDEV